MIDLHTHTIFSDGELLPSELVRRALVLGYSAIAITDHVDESNMEFVLERMSNVKEALKSYSPRIKVLFGVELTHVQPERIPSLIYKARTLGAEVVVVHGETIVEPVFPGTNRAAIVGGADILAHPGLISEQDVVLAKEKGVFLEISGRKGHCFTNGHLVKLSKRIGAKLIINSDAHSPGDLIDLNMAKKIAQGAGLCGSDFEDMRREVKKFVEEKFGKDFEKS